MRSRLALVFFSLVAVAAPSLLAQELGSVILRVISSAPPRKGEATPLVIWLDPLDHALPFTPSGHYTLLQKDRTFVPHVQVIPVGSTVQFPNADPFFHNVFSMYDGRRFDLGLYEAGTSRSVVFNRPGVSYIFCNIHPEMSAVILALSSPLYSITALGRSAQLVNIPPGHYELHFWIEGRTHADLETMTRNLTIKPGTQVLGDITASPAAPAAAHRNKFGAPYEHPRDSTY